MSLQPEDGTGLSDADSYVSLPAATSYFTAMGWADWDDLTQDEQEVALRKATQYIDAKWDYYGDPITSTQSLAFPRTDSSGEAYDWPPRGLIAATCELAKLSRSADLFLDVGQRVVVSETVGPIKREFDHNRAVSQPIYSLVRSLIRHLIKGGASFLPIERTS